MDALTSRKATPLAHTKEGLRYWIGNDLYAFAKLILYAHLGNQNQMQAHFHQPLCQHVQTTPYAENLYMLFRGSFKTSLLTVARNLQRLLAVPGHPAFKGRPCGPNTRILILSNKSENAERFLQEIEAHLKNSWLLWAFPDVLGTDPEKLPEHTKSGLTVLRSNTRLRGSSIAAVGVTTELTSTHYDHLTADDIVAKENSQTREMRESITDCMRKLRPLMDPWSTRDMVGTPWHHSDYWSTQIARKEHYGTVGFYRMPAWVTCAPDTTGGMALPAFGWVRPTFPERFTIPWLLREREEMGPHDFASQYLLDPLPADAAYFDVDRLDLVTQTPPIDDLHIVMAVDPAISQKKSADYTAMVVGGFDRYGDLWILEALQVRRDPLELVRLAYALRDRFPTMVCAGFEATNFQKAYLSIFEEEGRRRGVVLNPIKLERDTPITKNVRISNRLQPPWMAGHIHVLQSCQALAALLDEARRFRLDAESDHDDLLDAMADLYQIRNYPGAKQTFDDDPLEQEYRERDALERQMRFGRPWIDRGSLRMAWQQQKRLQEVQSGLDPEG
jgi:predicted phage terminase large subunit-like protein